MQCNVAEVGFLSFLILKLMTICLLTLACPPNPPLTWDFSHLSGGWEGQASVRRQIVIIVINFNRRKLKNPTSATLHYI